jgi:hypothetical protein
MAEVFWDWYKGGVKLKCEWGLLREFLKIGGVVER